jgi:PA14 domain
MRSTNANRPVADDGFSPKCRQYHPPDRRLSLPALSMHFLAAGTLSNAWLPHARAVRRLALMLGVMTLSSVVAPASTIGSPALPFSSNGTGLPTSVWQFSSFFGNTFAQADQAKGTSPPNATFLTTAVNYPLSLGSSSLQAFVGSSGSNFSGATLDHITRSYFILSGYIALTPNAANSVAFQLLSDDGSQLSVGGVQIINNEGFHSSSMLSGTAQFSQTGLYPIQIKYVDYNDVGQLRLTYDPANSGTFVDIPTSALFASVVTSSPEPDTWTVVVGGLIALWLGRRRFRRS